MATSISRIEALKQYCGHMTAAELIELKRGDPAGFLWLASEAARELGLTIEGEDPAGRQ